MGAGSSLTNVAITAPSVAPSSGGVTCDSGEITLNNVELSGSTQGAIGLDIEGTCQLRATDLNVHDFDGTGVKFASTSTLESLVDGGAVKGCGAVPVAGVLNSGLLIASGKVSLNLLVDSNTGNGVEVRDGEVTLAGLMTNNGSVGSSVPGALVISGGSVVVPGGLNITNTQGNGVAISGGSLIADSLTVTGNKQNGIYMADGGGSLQVTTELTASNNTQTGVRVSGGNVQVSGDLICKSN